MKQKITVLRELFKRFLTRDISAKHFDKKFNELFRTLNEKDHLTQTQRDVIHKIWGWLELFEPNPKKRADSMFIGERRLREVVKKELTKLEPHKFKIRKGWKQKSAFYPFKEEDIRNENNLPYCLTETALIIDSPSGIMLDLGWYGNINKQILRGIIVTESNWDKPLEKKTLKTFQEAVAWVESWIKKIEKLEDAKKRREQKASIRVIFGVKKDAEAKAALKKFLSKTSKFVSKHKINTFEPYWKIKDEFDVQMTVYFKRELSNKDRISFLRLIGQGWLMPDCKRMKTAAKSQDVEDVTLDHRRGRFFDKRIHFMSAGFFR
jgi:hypothetical protein